MACRRGVLLATLLLGSVAVGRHAVADVGTLRVVVPTDLAALSLIIARHDQLFEKQAEARGLHGVTVQWLTPNGGNPIDQLLNGQADVVATTDVVGFLLAWDARTGSPQEIRGLTALARMPISSSAAIRRSPPSAISPKRIGSPFPPSKYRCRR